MRKKSLRWVESRLKGSESAMNERESLELHVRWLNALENPIKWTLVCPSE